MQVMLSSPSTLPSLKVCNLIFIITLLQTKASGSSVVGIAIGDTGWQVRSSNPVRGRAKVNSGSGNHTVSYLIVTGSKQAGK
jgi:hypothetical protein